MTAHTFMGESALLRLGGCPIRVWLAAANPALFALVHDLERARDEYTALGARLAESIGVALVAHPALSRSERGLALELRRRLHNGLAVSEAACARLAARAHGLPIAGQLMDDLHAAARLSGTIAALEQDASEMAAHEEARVARRGLELAATTEATQLLLRHRNPAFAAEIADRRQRGDTWKSKTLKHYGDYVWEILDRAATKCTPRDWHGQVALLPVRGAGSALPPIRVDDQIATSWYENIHTQRQMLSGNPMWDAAEMRLALAPLHWTNGEHVQFLVVDASDPARMLEVELRRIPLLHAIYEVLSSAARTLPEFEAAVLARLGGEDADLLRKFTEHLIGLGVVQISSSPRGHLQEWMPRASMIMEQAAALPQVHGGEGAGALAADGTSKRAGFLDVYRRATTPLPLATGLRLQRLVEQAQRVLAAIYADMAGAPGAALPAAAADGPPRPLLEILKQPLLNPGDALPWQRRSEQWPRPQRMDSAYAQLLRFIEQRADEGAVVDVSAALLDEVGAPDGAIDWPIDAVLRLPRPGAGFEAVLDEAFAAGSLDARFISALRALHGDVPHADAYRQFLDQLEQQSGMTFLEVLVPPLSVGAANAVRRPIYTRAWTGDADLHTYCVADGPLPRYVPLDAITLRRVRGRLVAEVEGRPVCPMYHATRIPLAPWNMLVETLLAAAPLTMRWAPRRLHYPLDAFPARSCMPRITVGGGLVLAGAQWRVDPAHVWDPDARALDRLTALDRLRRRLGLPRWVFVAMGARRKPVPCDLESVRAARVFERAAREAEGEILIVEMLPPPDQFMVSDPAGGADDELASAIMLRLPCDESPEAMAARLAPAFARAGVAAVAR